MITVSQAVDEIIRRSPFLAEALSEDIANVSSVARRIRPQVEKRLLGSISEEAIAMALRRAARKKLKVPLSGIKVLKNLSNISVRSNIVEFIFPNPSDHIRVHRELLKNIEHKRDEFFHISRGLFESIVIVSADLEKTVDKILVGQKDISKINDLSSITIKLPLETIMTPGVYYPILKALAWEGLNLIEVISIATELSILFKNDDAERAFSVLKTLTSSV
jgi:hypothetical protein